MPIGKSVLKEKEEEAPPETKNRETEDPHVVREAQ